LVPALIVAITLVIQYRVFDVLVRGRVFWFEDIAAYFVPLYSAAARAMRAGDVLGWDPGGWSGQPLLGDPQIGLLYPPNWLWMILPPVRVYALLAIAHAALAAGGMWAFLRARGRSKAACGLGALALSASAFMVLELRHAMFGATTAWLPWALYAAERYAAERQRDHGLLLSLSLGLAILAGGWSMLYFGGMLVGLYGVLRAAARAEGRTACLAALGAFALLGVALAAAQLLPALAHARESPRALGVTYEMAASYAWPSFRYLGTLLFPLAYGDDARGTYVGAPDQWELCGYAVGAVTALLAPLSFVSRERRAERLAMVALILVAVLLAPGSNGPLHRFVYTHVPLYGQMRGPARALYLWTLAVPILGADGLDAAVAWVRTPRGRAVARHVALVGLAAELLITFRAENTTTPLASTLERPAAVALVAADRGRMVTDVHLGQRFHNAGLLWGLDCAGGYSSLPIWRYLHFLWIANHGAVYPHERLADDLTAQGVWTFSSPLVDLLAVRWVLMPHGRSPNGTGYQLMFSGSDGVDLWLNREALPRAFVVYDAHPAADEREAANAIADRSFDPARVAIVEGAPSLAPGRPGAPASSIATLQREPDRVLIEAVARAPGLLVLSEPFYPGWRATVDGVRQTVYRTDYALMGVPFPAGAHRVELELVSAPLRRGGPVSILALGVLLVLSRRWRRRRGAR
jgi:hypothetical protein